MFENVWDRNYSGPLWQTLQRLWRFTSLFVWVVGSAAWAADPTTHTKPRQATAGGEET